MPTVLRPPPPATRAPARARRGMAWILGGALAASCGPGAPGAERPVTADAAAERGAFHPDDVALVCSAPRWDFGAVWEGAVLEHEFLLVVEGSDALVVRATRADCGCTAPRLERVEADGVRRPYVMGTPVAPGGRLALRVRYDTRGKHGTLPRDVHLYCNQEGGVFSVTVQADVRSWLVAEPDVLPAFTMTDAETRELHVAVRAAEGLPFRLTPVRRAIPEPLTVEAEPRAPATEGRAAAWDVTIRLAPGMPRGPHVYPIHLASDVTNEAAAPDPEGRRPPHSVVLRLTVEVVGRFRIDPPQRILDFGIVRGDETVARTLRVTCLDPEYEFSAPRVRLVPLREDGPFPLGETAHLSTRPVSGEPAWDVQLLFDGFLPSVEPALLARLVIETGHPAEPRLEATVSGRVQRLEGRAGGPPSPSVR